MCTMIVEKTGIEGSGKGTSGWFSVNQVNVSYDHPFHAPYDHALSLDFVNESKGLDARVAVELSPDSAQKLVESILSALEQGKEQNL